MNMVRYLKFKEVKIKRTRTLLSTTIATRVTKNGASNMLIKKNLNQRKVKQTKTSV